MRLLAPSASTLEKLILGGNKLGGTITTDIAAFTKLTTLALHNMGLEGKVTWPSPGIPCRIDFTDFMNFCAGELPLALIRMKAKGCKVDLEDNKGFTLPSNIGELGDDIMSLDLRDCSLRGKFASASSGIPRAEAN